MNNMRNKLMVVCASLALLIASGCGTASNQGSGANAEPRVEMKDLASGTGEKATKGKKVTVHYTGKLADGTVFDSSIPKNRPFQFTLGRGEVIEGWDIGVEGMKVGGKRTLVIPPELGYGDEARKKIPANSTLYFEVELLKVENP